MKQSEPDTATRQLPAFDELWDYRDPSASEARFRELLEITEGVTGAGEYRAALLTQLARALGLQRKYDEAHRILDQAEQLITAEMTSAKVRSLLERGRLLNSAGRPAASVPLFEEALAAARPAGLDYHAVDAAHMLGIVTGAERSLSWNERAMRLAEASEDERARGWLGPLYNNTGWTYFEMGRFLDALALFEKDVRFRQSRGRAAEAAIAQWSMARVLRSLGRVDEALRLQQELLSHPERQGNSDEGYTREEVGENLLLLGRPDDAAAHFARAWELLRDDPWLAEHEPARLGRLKQLGQVK